MEQAELGDAFTLNPYYEKLYRVPNVYYRSWIEKHGGTLKGARVLDFGCGEGLASVGLSMFSDAASVVGVELGTDYLRLEPMLSEASPGLTVPANVQFRQAAPASSLGTSEFDVIVSWSVLEHVAQDCFDDQIAVLAQALRPGGLAVFQIAPLYHSAFGSHLFGVQEPWEHLTCQLDILHRKVVDRAGPAAEGMWNCFLTLNRFGEREFKERIARNGLKIIDVYETFGEHVPDDRLLRLFDGMALVKNQILLVCTREDTDRSWLARLFRRR
ncbi:MAG TPA: methyltransferase domain-containing protein [Ramlibacter sp.]|nr:methyltransferase domain-containing protein [Ramlibacter sp.]